MIQLQSNLPQVMAKLVTKVNAVLPGSPAYEQALATTGATLLRDMKTRIHEQGRANDGSAIGARPGKAGYLVASGALRDKLNARRTQKGIGLCWPTSQLYEQALAIEWRYRKAIWNATEEERQKAITETKEQLIEPLK